MARVKRTGTTDELTPFRPNYNSLLDSVERQFKLTAASTDVEARRSSYMSSGLLSTDLMLGGGILPGAWYTMFGAEQSAKSTHLMHILHGALQTDVPIILYFDFEGSMDPTYFESMMNTTTSVKMSEVFGQRDGSGNWVVTPRVRLYSESVAETFFDSMASLFRSLPDKLYLEGQWYFVYDNTKLNRKIVDGNYDKKLFSEFNKFYVKAPNGGPQALVFLDSYPMMFPDRLDDDGKGAGMASTARMFAENIPKVAGKLKKKGITLLGVNQLRLRPATSYGNPEYEPSGETVKFVSSVRVRQAARAVPHASGPIEEEDSATIDGGVDQYRYVHMKAIKNKTATPYIEAWQRVWIRDANGVAHGFCPAYDTFQYLKSTGQVVGTMKKMAIQIKPSGLSIPKLTFFDLKCLLLLKGAELREHCTKLGLNKNPKIRQLCFDQIRSGKGTELYFDNMKDSVSDDDASEEDEDE